MLWNAGARNGPTSNLMESRRCGLLFRRLFLYGITFAPHPPITSRSLNSKLQNSESLFQWTERLNKASIKSKTSSCLQFVDRYFFYLLFTICSSSGDGGGTSPQNLWMMTFVWNDESNTTHTQTYIDIWPRCEGENEKIFQIKHRPMYLHTWIFIFVTINTERYTHSGISTRLNECLFSSSSSLTLALSISSDTCFYDFLPDKNGRKPFTSSENSKIRIRQSQSIYKWIFFFILGLP